MKSIDRKLQIKPLALFLALTGLTALTIGDAAVAKGRPAGTGGGGKTTDVTQEDPVSSTTLDANEVIHLVFMREEEKLARDVYTTLGGLYPDATIFGNIDDSEQTHTTKVRETLESYGVEDPNTNDNIGMFTGEEYGWYFTEKYNYLVDKAAASELDALYVGAFIEELDMLDIIQCPKVVVETDNGIDDVSECGQVYTDNPDVAKVYENLLEGSKDHLRAYVGNIEAVTGKGSYTAQVLTQEEVDAILGR
jgi:hypothetical protein